MTKRKIIYKYNIDAGGSLIEIPANAKFLNLGYDGLNRPAAWFEIDENNINNKITAFIFIIGTGWAFNLDSNDIYLGTLVDNYGDVWHYYMNKKGEY